MTMIRPARMSLVALLVSLALPVHATAQEDTGSLGWAPVMVGIRAGFLHRTNSAMVGAQVRIPVIPSGLVELMPNASITFLKGPLDQYEYSLDAVWVSGGRRGGLYAGAGAALRNGVFNQNVGRETRKGWDLVLGLKTMPGRTIPIGIQLEERLVFMHLPINPSVLSIGVNVPLWGWGHFGR